MRIISSVGCCALTLCVGVLGMACTSGSSTSSSSSSSGNTSSSSSGSSGASSSSSGSTSSSSSSSSSSGSVNVVCNSPQNAVALCDVQNTASPIHPSPGTEVTFPNPLVVTSNVFILSTTNGVTTKGFFVAEGAGGPYRTGLVKGEGSLVDALGLTLGAQLLLTAKVQEFQGTGTGTETQLELVGGNVLSGTGTVPAALVVDAASFGSDAGGEPYEGGLITVSGVNTVRFDSGAIMEYGAFRLSGGLLVDDMFYRYDAGLGETFSSITGFVRYSYDGKYTLNPRDAADVVSSGNPRHSTEVTVTQIQDPANLTNLPHCVAPADCDPLKLTRMVVTAGPRVSDKDAAGNALLMAVFVQDPTQLDANLEPLPYSGLKVVFGKTNITSTYAMTMYTTSAGTMLPDTRDSPQDWPMPGDIIDIEGTAQEYFDMTQMGNVRVLNKVGTIADMPLPIAAVPVPKSLTGESVLSGLSSGKNGVAMCVDPVAPGADSEKWEGVLVKLLDVTTTLACVPTATNSTSPPACVQPDFGYFQVTGGVEIGTGQGTFFSDRCTATTCTCDGPDRVPNDRRLLGKHYTSITGIFDYAFSVFRVNPRSGITTDVVE